MDRIIENLMIIAFITLAAYPIMKTKSFKRTVLKVASTRERIFIGILFGCLSVLGNLTSFDVFNNIKIHSSMIGPLTGGMIGGPMVGIIAAIMGALYRLTIHNVTVVPDIISLMLAGIAGGVFFFIYRKKQTSLISVYLWAVLMEGINIFLIIGSIQPRILTGVYMSMIGRNLLLVNPVGVVMFLSLIKDVQYNQNLTGANYAEKSLTIAKHTLRYLKTGFTRGNMERIARIIYDYVGVPAVAVVSVTGERVHVGQEYPIADFHREHPLSSGRESSESFWEVHLKGKDNESTIDHFEDYSVISAPLWLNEELIGALQFYKPTNEIVPPDIKMIEGIAGLLSLQIHNSTVADQEKLLIESEYNALKAQVNPHFLYNILNVIRTMIRMKPDKAQELVVDLADFYRRSLSERGGIAPLVEELKLVKSYMDLQSARFGEKVTLTIDIEDDIYDIMLPTFSIQPLVENSIIHGMIEDDEHVLEISIQAFLESDHLHVLVEDNGKGFDEEVINKFATHSISKKVGIGLDNISLRLKSLYGDHCWLRLSNHGTGARVTFKIPVNFKMDGGQND